MSATATVRATLRGSVVSSVCVKRRVRQAGARVNRVPVAVALERLPGAVPARAVGLDDQARFGEEEVDLQTAGYVFTSGCGRPCGRESARKSSSSSDLGGAFLACGR